MGEPKLETNCPQHGIAQSPATPRAQYHISSPTIKQGRTFTNIYSEGGHDLAMIEPLPNHRGESVCGFFKGLFATMIGLSTLGSSVTFSLVISPMPSTPGDSPLPRNSRFSVDQLQVFIGIAFFLFLITLAFTSLCSTLLTFFKRHLAEDWDGLHGKHSRKTVQYYAVIVSSIIGAQIIAAFIFICLVVVAFQPVIGWLCFSFVCLFGLIILISILFQLPWPYRSNKENVDDLRKRGSIVEEVV